MKSYGTRSVARIALYIDIQLQELYCHIHKMCHLPHNRRAGMGIKEMLNDWLFLSFFT